MSGLKPGPISEAGTSPRSRNISQKQEYLPEAATSLRSRNIPESYFRFVRHDLALGGGVPRVIVSDAGQQNGAEDQKGDEEEPCAEDDLPEQTFLLLDDAERSAGENEAGVGAGDAAHLARDANAGLRLPGDAVGVVGAKIVEDSDGRRGDGLIQIAVGAYGSAGVVVEDHEGFEALLKIDGAGWDDVFGFAAGRDLRGVGAGHLDLGLVGASAKHLLKDERRGSAHEGEDEAEGESVEEDGTGYHLFADHEHVLLERGFEEVGEEVKPEEGRAVSPLGIQIGRASCRERV